MKLAITGKGGVGKTTLAVFLAKYLRQQGQDVILIDADPDANAAMALGLDGSVDVPPIIELEDLIRERTGAGDGTASYFSLTPRVDDIPDRYAVDAGGVKLLRMGRLRKGGTGCMCPENAFVRSLLTHLVLSHGQVVILDMEAGVEHLGRATAQGVDWMIVVVDPGKRSIQTARAVTQLAADIGVRNVGVVVNKYKTDQELAVLQREVAPLPVLGKVPYDETVAAADLEGVCAFKDTPEQRRWVEEILAGVRARSR